MSAPKKTQRGWFWGLADAFALLESTTKKGDQKVCSGWKAENIAEVLDNKSDYKGMEFTIKYIKILISSESHALYHFTEEPVLYACVCLYISNMNKYVEKDLT